MESITLNELIQATGGELLGGAYGAASDGNIRITGVQSDNRLVKPGDVFFAFIGEKMDGHRFVQAALEAGAAGAVISEAPGEGPFLPGKFYVLVKDTIRAVGDLARYYRSRLSIPVVGVTGSVGKTTTKDMIASVLAERFRTVKTQGNFNNNIGLPRTIFTLTKDTEMAVVEMGMNHMGEIDYLVHIAQPTCAVITNIGEAHIGNLGSKENIFRAKCEIFNGLQKGGFAVMNGDDEYLQRLRYDAGKNADFSFTYIGESPECEWRAVEIQDDLEECMKFTAVTPIGTFPVTVPALGHHLIYPALTAAAIGAHYGMTVEEIQSGIAHYVPTKLRMEAIHLPGNVLIYNDTYNANPQSMKSGLLTLSHNKAAHKVAVLGDMFELGDSEEALHREVGAYAAGLGIDELVTVGKAAGYIADEAKKQGFTAVVTCDDKAQAEETIRKLYRPDTAWLFKASHGMQLGELAEFTQSLAGQG